MFFVKGCFQISFLRNCYVKIFFSTNITFVLSYNYVKEYDIIINKDNIRSIGCVGYKITGKDIHSEGRNRIKMMNSVDQWLNKYMFLILIHPSLF